jgi:Leucine-rich repeat (LRR) protein
VPAGVATLTLIHNAIATLPAGLYPANSSLLLYLHLDDNLISKIDPAAFVHLRHLFYLSLNMNFLTEIDPVIFSPLQALDSLVLSRNLMSRIPVLPAMAALRNFNAQANPLREVTAQSFAAVSRLLKTLVVHTELSTNPEALDPLLLRNFSDLRILDLRGIWPASNQLPDDFFDAPCKVTLSKLLLSVSRRGFFIVLSSLI